MSEVKQPFSLAGKKAIVTGAASGIGQAIAIGLAEAGAELLLLGHRSNMEDTSARIAEAGGSSREVLIDLSDLDSLDRNYQELVGDEPIDILVNNAGIIWREPAAEYTASKWHEVINVNLHAVFQLSQLVGKGMLKREQGKIINIASLLSFQGGILVPAYTASKHAVAGLTKALANEWASRNVQVNAIAPGYIATANTKAIREDAERNQSILSRIPAGRWGEASDLAGAAVFLASSASNYVNGHVLAVDGGWLAR
ncbi:2-dehydro-3-deoxy-D-gluconate 5-dehydrogenase KduD [Paenibacillus pinisoli]|uniref:2-dehydro-3-deoxy-D-gluconate 5-dehydrogenase KduD n=1 Tax=Paenibacillus pinisoli TaxID=1276110 RepID=A0A3A6PD58_9BACL|nr:2-dehydro-3-deoxy-D-gluconate 5-dehydrogenase KduD [Paenibacillus pinisoli]RJX38607.1 2-dehydro-3-deoxy-D-gluconate 5-dehydrogenase KduD [Paenibacillus pinisoli]